MSYPGGKGRMRQHLISMIPPHRVYVETHLGGGAIMRAKLPAVASIGIDIDPAVLEAWQAGPDAARLVRADATEFLRGYEFHGDEFVYCDPPYLPSTRRCARIYRHEMDADAHTSLLEVLKTLPCAVMVSGYRSRLYDSRLTGWKRIDSLQRTQAGVAIESVWLNYDPPTVLHDHRYLGRNFREREAVKRRRNRLTQRIQALPEAERCALLAELAGHNPLAFRSIAESVGR